MRDRPGNQDPIELRGFLDFVRAHNVRSYCEIGCRNGDTFLRVMQSIGAVPGARGLAVDLPEDRLSRQNLSDAVNELRSGGIQAYVVWGNSQSGRGSCVPCTSFGAFSTSF